MKERLYRSRIDRVFGGVCSGLSQYLNLDPILVRVIFIILSIINGLGFLLYIVLWIVVPEDPNFFEFKTNMGNPEPPKGQSANENSTNTDTNTKYDFSSATFPQKKNGSSGRIIVGVLFIGLGFLFFVDRIFPYFDFEDFLPILFIIVGIALLWNSLKK